MDLLIIFFAKYFIFLIIIFVGLFLLNHHGHTKLFYKNALIIFLSALCAWIVAYILKDIIKHPRPDETLALIKDGSYSFPSGHTTFISALGMSLSNINKKIGYKIIFLSLIVGFARVLAGVHFWYDILGGLVLGIVISFALTKLVRKFI